MTVHEIEMRLLVFRDMMGVKRIIDIFKPVRETPRTYCNVFQTYISHKINHVSKPSANSPPKKRNSHFSNIYKDICSFLYRYLVLLAISYWSLSLPINSLNQNHMCFLVIISLSLSKLKRFL